MLFHVCNCYVYAEELEKMICMLWIHIASRARESRLLILTTLPKRERTSGVDETGYAKRRMEKAAWAPGGSGLIG